MDYEGKTALVIDDEEEIREILVFYLENEGFKVDEVSSGEEGIVMAKKSSYDLVITDLSMPGMNGEQVIEILRSESITAKLVISSGSLTIDESKIDGILFKPFNKDNIKEMLEKVFV